MTISLAEYSARVRRLKQIVSDIDASYNADEGLTLTFVLNGKRSSFVGETCIIEAAESLVKEQLSVVVKSFDEPVLYNRFRKPGE